MYTQQVYFPKQYYTYIKTQHYVDERIMYLIFINKTEAEQVLKVDVIGMSDHRQQLLQAVLP